MNFYLFLSVFVVVSLGPWAAAKDVFLHLRKTSARDGPAEETKRKLSGDVGLPLINGLVQVASKTRTWAQCLRRFLKALRKWCHSHPPEVKLGKCLTSYFNIKLPGIRSSEKAVDYPVESKVTEHPKASKMRKIKRKTTKGRKYARQKSISKGNSFWNDFLSPVQDFLRKIKNRLLHYVDAMYRNDLAVCAWEYIWKKFWIWVDSAPDSRLWL